MNRTPITVYQHFAIEADARGGRYTRGCFKGSKATAQAMAAESELGIQSATGGDALSKATPDGPWWCAMGPLMRGSLMLETYGWQVNEEFGLFSGNVNSNASWDDVSAWSFAARWWNNYCWQMYAQAVKVAPSIGKNWPKNGPDDPRFAPSRVVGPVLDQWHDPKLIETNIGGTQFLHGMYVLDSTWPFYLNSMTAQIVAKSVAANVVDLILIQITLKHCSLFFKSCLNPTSDPDLMKLLNPDARLS